MNLKKIYPDLLLCQESIMTMKTNTCYTIFTLVLVFLIIFNSALIAGSAKPLRVTVLDVKQGDAILIVSPSGKTILIDGADRTAQYKDKDGHVKTFYPAFDSIIPYMKRSNITKIDQLIISHPHADHIGGLYDLINNIKVLEITDSYEYTTNMYKDLRALAKKKNIKWTKVYRGDVLNWGGGATATVMHPPKNFHLDSSVYGLDKHDPMRGNLNNVSVVLRVQLDKIRYLLTGDAEKEAEEEMFSYWKDFKTTALKCAHHGSKTSSSPGFLEKCDPKFAFISVGEVNKFKHPDTKHTLPNIKHYTTKNNGGMYRTDQKGTIETWTFGEKIHIACEKGENAFISHPENIEVLCNAAIVEWTTSNPSTTEISINEKTYKITGLTNKHRITVTGLSAGKTYKYTVLSRETAQGKAISAKGSLTTDTFDPSLEQASISNVKMIPSLPYFAEKATFTAKVKNPASGLRVVFYKDTIEKTHQLASVKVSSVNVEKEWKTSFTGKFKLFAALYKGSKLLSVADTTALIATKKALIDVYHWNSGTYKNNMSSYKLDLIKNGFEVFENHKPITASALKNMDIFIITDPRAASKESGSSKASPPDFSASEVKAVKSFVSSGKGLLIACQNDYKGNMEAGNKILEALGSSLRFNDDTVIDKTHIGWERTIQCPNVNHSILSSAVKEVLCSNSCSLVSSSNKPIKSLKNVVLTSKGSTDFANKDTDSNNDAVIYPENILIPISAVEKLSSGGRLAVFGSSYQLSNSVYTHSTSHQTDLFNLQISQWLSEASKKSDKSIFAGIQKNRELLNAYDDTYGSDSNESEELLIENFMNCLEKDNYDEAYSIYESMQNLPPEKLKWIKPGIKKMITAITFIKLQKNSSPKWDVLYNNLIDLLENE
jgi:competence protein ComEC